MPRSIPAPAAPRRVRRPGATAVVAALAAGLALPAAARAQDAPSSPTPSAPPPSAVPAFPDTPLGRRASALLAAIDGGDSVAIARFVDAHLGRDLMRGRSPAAVAGTLRRIHEQGGGLEPLRVRELGSTLRVMTRARNGLRLLGLELEGAPDDTARLVIVGLYPMDESMTRPPEPWATAPLDEAGVARVIRERVRAAAAEDRFAGVVLVARGDRVLVHEALGWADEARGRRNTPETAFQTTSVGKMFTGVAVAQLAERGLLRLDDTLARLLPDYPNRAAAGRVTIRQLLTHTAGVPEPFLAPRTADVPADAPHDALLAAFADAPLTMEPGARHQYGNGNYVALAAVIERLADTTYEAYLRRAVWEPSGMRRAAPAAWPGAPDLARPHARFAEHDPLGVEPRRPAPEPGRVAPAALRGFGGGAYTAHDLFRFARALRTGRLLSPAMTDSVVRGRVDAGVGGPVAYGLGFYEQLVHGRRVVGHRGSNPDTGWDADVELLWDGEWTVVVLSNFDAPAAVQLSMPILDLLARQP